MVYPPTLPGETSVVCTLYYCAPSCVLIPSPSLAAGLQTADPLADIGNATVSSLLLLQQ